MAKYSVLFVCLGNICRSPMAKGLMEEKLQQYGLDWHVESASIDTYHEGEAPDPRAQKMMEQYDIDISDQRARPLRVDDFEKFDKILVMDKDNYLEAYNLAANDKDREKLEMILEYSHPGEKKSVPDPYWNDDGFSHVYELLDEALDQFIQQVTDSQKEQSA